MFMPCPASCALFAPPPLSGWQKLWEVALAASLVRVIARALIRVMDTIRCCICRRW